MSATASLIAIRMRLSGAKQVATEATAASTAIAGTGAATAKANATTAATAGSAAAGTKKTGAAAAGAATALGRGAKAASLFGGALALVGGAAIYKSVKNVETLAKSTAALSGATGLEAETSSAWVQTAAQRGVAAKQLQMGFTVLGKSIRAANQGGQTQLDLFDELGVSQEQLKRGNPSDILRTVADAYANSSDELERAAINQTLFGRSGQAMLPILKSGGTELDKLIGKMEKHNALSQKDVDSALASVKAQRRLDRQWQSLSITLGTEVMPTVVKFLKGLGDLFEQMRKGKGEGANLMDAIRFVGDAFKWMWNAGKNVVMFLRNQLTGSLISTQNFFLRLASSVVGTVADIRRFGQSVGTWIAGAFQKAKGVVNEVVLFIMDRIVDAQNAIDRLGGGAGNRPRPGDVQNNLNGVAGGLGNLSNYPSRHSGGLIGGYGDVLTVTRGGEFVQQKSAVQGYGIKTMEAVNEGRAQIITSPQAMSTVTIDRGSGSGPDGPLVANLYLDGRIAAKAVFKAAEKEKARR